MSDEAVQPPPRTNRAMAWLARALLASAGALLGVLLLSLWAQPASAAASDPGVLAGRVAALSSDVGSSSPAAGAAIVSVAGAAGPVVSTEPVAAAVTQAAPVVSAVVRPVAAVAAAVAAPSVSGASHAAAAAAPPAAPVAQPVSALVVPVVDAATPVMGPVATTARSVVAATAPVASTVGRIVAPAVDAVRPVDEALSALGDVLTPVLEVTQPVSEALAPVGDALAPVVGLVTAVVDGLAPVPLPPPGTSAAEGAVAPGATIAGDLGIPHSWWADLAAAAGLPASDRALVPLVSSQQVGASASIVPTATAAPPDGVPPTPVPEPVPPAPSLQVRGPSEGGSRGVAGATATEARDADVPLPAAGGHARSTDDLPGQSPEQEIPDSPQ